MIHFRRLTPILAMLVLLLAACGGGGATSTEATGSTAVSEATQASTTEAPATEAPPSEAPSIVAPVATAEPPGGGGGTAAGVCDLVTADELAEIFKVASVTTKVFAGPPDTCSVDSAAGDSLVAWSYSVMSAATAQATYDAFVSDPSSVEVSGIGDKAALVQNTGLLVLKGAALSVISVMSDDQEEQQALEKQIGAIAAGRM